MTVKKIAFIHPYLLHYHFPRFHAFAEVCAKSNIAFENITLTGYLDIYRIMAQETPDTFQNVTLFPTQEFNDVSAWKLWFRLRKELNRFKPDVIFLYGYSYHVMRLAKIWADSRRVAAILISDSNTFDHSRKRTFEWLKRRFVSRYDAAFVGGASSSRYLQELGIPAERILPGYDVIDNETFRTKTIANRQNINRTRARWGLPADYFIFAGRTVKEKNIRRLLDVYLSYVYHTPQNEPPWHLVICGSGPEEEELHWYVETYHSEHREFVHFFGHVNQPDLINIFSCANCFILPSLSESWGLVVNEAMACGLPVLVSKRCGCAADLVVNGVNGWVFDPDAPDELGRLLQHVHALPPARRIQMGCESENIIAQWGLDRFAENALACARIARNHRDRIA